MGCDIHVVAEVRSGDKWSLSDIEIPHGRDYNSFAILANVRNGYGFAGCDTGDELQFISLPRGLPVDLSFELNDKLQNEKETDFFWLGDHSFSWVTLQEMLDYPYAGEIVTRGLVTAEQAKKYKLTGEAPKTWCGWTNIIGYESIEWERPMKEAAWLFGEIIEKISPIGEPENVRIVFGFDS